MRNGPVEVSRVRHTVMDEGEGYPTLVVTETTFASGRAQYRIRRHPNEFTKCPEIEISCAELEALMAFRKDGLNG